MLGYKKSNMEAVKRKLLVFTVADLHKDLKIEVNKTCIIMSRIKCKERQCYLC